MSIFSKKNENSDEYIADNLITTLRDMGKKEATQIASLIETYRREPDKSRIKPFALFLDVISMIVQNTGTNSGSTPVSMTETLRYGENVYPYIFPYDEETPNFADLRNFFLEMFEPHGIIGKRVFLPTLYELFTDKRNYMKWATSVPGKNEFRKYNEVISNFALRSRAYFTDEDAYTVNLMYVTSNFLKGVTDERIFEENLSELRRMAGVYDVSEERILSAEQQINDIQRTAQTLNDSLSLVEQRAQLLKDISDNTVKSTDEYCKNALTRMQARISNLSEDMEKAHREFLDIQRQDVLANKDELVNSVIADTQNAMNELKKTANRMVSAAKAELLRANRESDDAISKIEAYLANDERLQKTLANAQDSKVLNERLDKLMILKDSTLDYVADQVTNQSAAPAQTASAGGQTVVIQEGQAPAPVMNTTIPTYVEEEEIQQVSYLLDESIPFQERWQEAMTRKQMLLERGEHFHAVFDDVLCAVIENANPYLIGPSGCGKTFMIHQIQEILGLESIDIGYINEEYDILGFQTANGGYSRPNFYRCYKFGKIAFCDELDNGNSRATVKLNSFLSNNKDACYSFPNGENVRRHPNFRIVAAGNTTGNGADANYNSREKIEESVQQRFTPIFVNYDNNVEKAILEAHPAWYQFVVMFRNATNAWSRYSHTGAPGIFTTRDAARVRKYLDNKSFSPAKIIEFEFIQTKEPEYLAFLAKEMTKDNCSNKECEKLIEYFCHRVELIRSGKDTNRMF